MTPYDYYMVKHSASGTKFPPLKKLTFYVRYVLANNGA